MRERGAGTSSAAPVTSPAFEWTTAHEIEQVPQVTHFSGAKLTFLKVQPSTKSGLLKRRHLAGTLQKVKHSFLLIPIGNLTTKGAWNRPWNRPGAAALQTVK
jgi:hypothetical protein